MPDHQRPEIATKDQSASFSDANDLIEQYAYRLYSTNVDWVTFFRQVFGPRGIVSLHYPTVARLSEFERSDLHAKLQGMMAELRARPAQADSPQEPTRMITVRLPVSLHEALKAEAGLHGTSVNKLCIAKLVQLIDAELVSRPNHETPTEEEPKANL